MTMRFANRLSSSAPNRLPLLAGFLFGIVAPTAGAQIYKSIGPDGRPVYSDVAPSSAKARISVLKTEPAPVANESAQVRDEQKEAARRKAQEAKESRQIRENLAAAEAARACESAREALKLLEKIDGQRAYWRDPNGERTYLSDEQRSAAQSKAQQAVAQNCP